MPLKKKVTKRSTNKPLVKQALPKLKPRRRTRKQAAPKTGRRATDRAGEVFVVRDGETAIFHVTVDPSIREVTVSLNGRGVFKGQP